MLVVRDSFLHPTQKKKEKKKKVLVFDCLYLLVVNCTRQRDLFTHINASQKRNKALASTRTHQFSFFYNLYVTITISTKMYILDPLH